MFAVRATRLPHCFYDPATVEGSEEKRLGEFSARADRTAVVSEDLPNAEKAGTPESATYDWFGLLRMGRNGFYSRYILDLGIRRTDCLCVDQEVPVANTAATVEHSGEFEEPE